MPLYQITDQKLEVVQVTTFSEEKVLERKDLQRLLMSDISPLGDDLLVIAEEFGDWEESYRRIDLLCLDKQQRLVVIEIKRTEDGGHMELQAIRYAAMVSSMTLDQAIAAHAKHLGEDDADTRSKKEILEFLEADSTEELELSGDVRIILVASDFSTELTTSVIWLNKYDVDITCIRLRPYKLADKVLIDVAQIIPLPEAAQYEVKIRAREQETRKAKSARQEIFRRFWAQFIERSRASTALLANRSTTTDHWLSAGIGKAGFHLSCSLTEDRARIECYMRFGKDNDERSKAAYRALLAQREAIERDFGDSLDWQELPDRIGSRICKDLEGSWRSPDSDWGELQDRMIRTLISLERALREPIRRLSV